MGISQQEEPEGCRRHHEEESDDDSSEGEGSDPEYDPEVDFSYDILEETQDGFSNMSIKKKSKSRVGKAVDLEAEDVEMEQEEVDEQSFEKVLSIIQVKQLEKLKLEQCKVYLRKQGLRLTGNKDTLIRRIKEHLEILNGGGEKKYPASSFVLNCKGDACTGDVVMFEQKVYDMYSIVSRSAIGPSCGIRTVVGRIVKESYGAAKQQHTFTVEVLWSKGEKPLPPLHPLLIKGRNLYRMKTLRQRWEDEEERCKILMEKHSRGSIARSERETRIHDKEKRKLLRENRTSKKEGPSKQSRLVPSSINGFGGGAQKQGSQPQKPELVDATERVNYGPPQPYPLSDILIKPMERPTFHPVQHNGQREDDNRIQIPHYSVNLGAIVPEFHEHRVHSPERYVNDQRFPTTKYADITGKDGASRNYNGPLQRQPLKSNSQRQRPTSPPHCPQPPYRQEYSRLARVGRQCRYYAQGRCYFGENCKFQHEVRQ